MERFQKLAVPRLRYEMKEATGEPCREITLDPCEVECIGHMKAHSGQRRSFTGQPNACFTRINRDDAGCTLRRDTCHVPDATPDLECSFTLNHGGQGPLEAA